MKKARIYSTILERIFSTKYKSGATQVEFAREDISRAARELGIGLPKNLGDLVYSFRYRAALPDSVREKAATGKAWINRGAAPAKYAFVLVPDIRWRLILTWRKQWCLTALQE